MYLHDCRTSVIGTIQMKGEGRVEDAEQVVAASLPAYCRDSLETLSKIEDCLHISILQEELEMA